MTLAAKLYQGWNRFVNLPASERNAFHALRSRSSAIRADSVSRSFISQSVDHVFDLLGAEDWMDRNEDGVGEKNADNCDDLVKGLLHANTDTIARAHT